MLIVSWFLYTGDGMQWLFLSKNVSALFNHLYYSSYEEGYLSKCCFWTIPCLRFTQLHTFTLGRYLIQSESHTVVHPPAGCLLPWSYQLDMFHHAVCGWISHTRINSTFKNTLPSTPALSSHQTYTPTHMPCLVHAITPNKHCHISQKVLAFNSYAGIHKTISFLPKHFV